MLRISTLLILCLPMLANAQGGKWWRPTAVRTETSWTQSCPTCPLVAQPVRLPASKPTTAVYAIDPTWWRHTDYPGDLFLYQDNRVLGVWQGKTRLYYPYKDGKIWHERRTTVPPLPLPQDATGTTTAEPQIIGRELPTGVVAGRLSHVEKITVNDMPIDLRAATEILELSDDSQKSHLSVIARDPALRDRILRDLAAHPTLDHVRKTTRVQGYDPSREVDALMLAPFRMELDRRFRQTGLAIYIQPPAGPEGKAPVNALYEYAGPEALAAALGPQARADALRLVDPNTDPNKFRTPAGNHNDVFVIAFIFLLALLGIAWWANQKAKP